MSIWDDLPTRIARWRDADHDDLCEARERSFICLCDKRSRIASGLTTLPSADLYFPPPSCPVCDMDLWHDGDGWQCTRCHLSWASDGRGSSVEFTDDYGADLGGEQFGPLLRDLASDGGAPA